VLIRPVLDERLDIELYKKVNALSVIVMSMSSVTSLDDHGSYK
jgi:hypothetical protein